MASPSRPALSASSLKTSEWSLVPSWTQSYEWLEKKQDLASFTILESQRKASAQLGLSEVNQVGASHLLELDGPSSMALGIVSSIDVLPAALAKDATFLAVGTVWALMAVLLLGVPWQVDQMEVMEVIAPTRHGRRWPDS